MHDLRVSEITPFVDRVDIRIVIAGIGCVTSSGRPFRGEARRGHHQIVQETLAVGVGHSVSVSQIVVIVKGV